MTKGMAYKRGALMELIKECGFPSANAVSREMNVSRELLSTYCRGADVPTEGILERLVGTLGTSKRAVKEAIVKDFVAGAKYRRVLAFIKDCSLDTSILLGAEYVRDEVVDEPLEGE